MGLTAVGSQIVVGYYSITKVVNNDESETVKLYAVNTVLLRTLCLFVLSFEAK